MYLTIIILVFQFFLNSCSLDNPKRAGLVVSRVYYFDTLQHKYIYDELFWPELKIFYCDSLIVEQIKYLYMENKVMHTNRRTEVDHYTFIDLRHRMFYDYTSFSDTGRLIKKYSQPDSVPVFSGWNFYNFENIPASGPSQILPDTNIDGKDYKRYRFVNRHKKDSLTLNDVTIAYADCKKKGTMFQYDKQFSEETGCPLIRMDKYFDGSKGPFTNISAVLLFDRNSLTQKEIEIFKKWEQYAKDNPVYK